ncbi:MAG: diguanylate cyclase response regulator, partial [Epsilonproteobacteria bacterium]
KERQIKTEKKVYYDSLTKVYNRRKFDEVFESEFKLAQQDIRTCTIAIIDIDKFKDFNDTYGHLIGDEVLITMAKTINQNIRSSDLFARWGGEEFVLLFRETDSKIVLNICQKLKDKVQENEHPTAGSITVSFGVTEYKEGDSIESIFKRCDEALYLAKENGRNRIEVL